MHPILFTVGDFSVHTYGFLGAVGFLTVVFVVLRRAAALGYSRDRVVDVMFWGAVTGLVGSRLVYVVQNPEQFHTLGQVLNIRGGGLVFYGALLTGVPVGAVLLRRFNLPTLKLLDMFGSVFPLGHAVTRLGCFAAGCCHGRQTDVSWAVTFLDPLSAAPKGVPLHPTQLYEAGYLVAIFAVVTWFYPRKRFDGQVMALYLALYALGRTIVEFYRGDVTRGYFLPEVLGDTLSFSQGTSLLVAAIAFGIFVVGARRAAQATPAA